MSELLLTPLSLLRGLSHAPCLLGTSLSGWCVILSLSDYHFSAICWLCTMWCGVSLAARAVQPQREFSLPLRRKMQSMNMHKQGTTSRAPRSSSKLLINLVACGKNLLKASSAQAAFAAPSARPQHSQSPLSRYCMSA